MEREGERAGAPDLSALVERLAAESCEVAHVGLFDLNATFRERRVRVGDLARVFGPGGSFANVLHQWDTGERVFGAGPFVSEPVAIDPASLRPYPFEAKACAPSWASSELWKKKTGLSGKSVSEIGKLRTTDSMYSSARVVWSSIA